MPHEQTSRARALYESAVKMPSGERAAWLHAVCGDDAVLLAETQHLLARHTMQARDSREVPVASELSAGSMVSHYRVEGRIGAGSMGTVYRATDIRLRRPVALKVIQSEFGHRSQREARVVASLNHPNICTLLDVGPEYLVMEFVEGSTLADRIARGPIPTREALIIARQIALALQAAHDKDVIHRDLKPANIKVSSDNKIKVLDFGLAKIEHATGHEIPDSASTLSDSVTQPGTILGTAAYMSPEQASGKPVDKRADVWAFGAVLWEMLTGRRLFSGETATQTIAEVLRGPIDFRSLPANTPPEVRRLLGRCLERELDNRLRDISEARAAIDSPPETAASEPTPRSRSRWMWLAGTALLAALATGAAVVWLRPATPAPLRLKAQIPAQSVEWTILGISPDGRYLSLTQCDAFACKISVRPLNSLEAHVLGEGQFLTWSPDSKFLLSMIGPKLYKTSVFGGQPTLVADAGQWITGAAWLDAGTIVLAAEGGIYTLPASGGTPARLSERMDGVAWLPGGRFLAADSRGVFATSLNGGKPVQVLPDEVLATYVPPQANRRNGHLVYLRDGVLLAQEFDLGKLQTVGDPVPIVAAGTDPGGVSVISFSTSRNGVLAYRTGNRGRLSLTWFDRSGKQLQTVSQAFTLGDDATNRLSPDDSKAAVMAARPDGSSDVWIADLVRGSFTRFTFDGSGGAIWSPDSKRLIWEDQKLNLYARAADGDGSNEFLFRNPSCSCLLYDWSQDGKLVSFATIERGKARIYLADLADRKPYVFRQGDFNDFYGMFSPDHRWLAYGSDESGRTEVYVESIPAGGRRVQVSIDGGNWPLWRRDGTELFFRRANDVMVVPVRKKGDDIEIGKPQKLFSTPIVTRFMVSRDAQRFLVALPVEGAQTEAPITIDTDWRAGLPGGQK